MEDTEADRLACGIPLHRDRTPRQPGDSAYLSDYLRDGRRRKRSGVFHSGRGEIFEDDQHVRRHRAGSHPGIQPQSPFSLSREQGHGLASGRDGQRLMVKWNKDSKLNGLMVLLAAIGLWEIVSRLGLINALFFPPMTKILSTFFQLVFSGEMLHQVLMSLKRAAAGYFLAAIVFIPLGLAMGIFQWLHRALEIIVETLRPIPPPVIVPVAMLFFGLGDGMKIFVIYFSCAWPILLNTIDGVRNIDRVLVHTARTFGLSQRKTIMKVILPAASPQIVTGFRISLAITLILVVISEMIGSTDGIGYFILDSQRRFRVAQMYAGMLALAILGYTLNQVFNWLYKFLLPWHKRKME